jgi:hypothetical protein
LLPRRWTVLQKHCSFFGDGVGEGQFPSFLGKMLSISPVLPEFQGGCRKEWLRTQTQNGGRDIELSSYFQLICVPKQGVSAPQQKQLLWTCYKLGAWGCCSLLFWSKKLHPMQHLSSLRTTTFEHDWPQASGPAGLPHMPGHPPSAVNKPSSHPAPGLSFSFAGVSTTDPSTRPFAVL